MDRKESRQVNHLLHIMKTDLVCRCWEAGVNTIAIGDLTGIREQIDYGPTLNQCLHSWTYEKIIKMVEYKAGLYGIEVVKVSEVYSSQTCHGCGEVRKTNGFILVRLQRRTYANVNGAANLFRAAHKYLQSRSDGVVGMWRPPWSCQSDWVGIRSTN
jgi:IS605 OrfB family transposase